MLLFRNEVMEAQRNQFLGAIRVGRNPSFTAVTVSVLLLAVAFVAYTVWGEVTRKSKLAGILVPTEGTLNLSVTQAGTLVDVRIKEGDSVETNQVLMVVGTDRTTSQGDAAKLIAQSLEQRRATLQTERALDELQFRQRQQATTDRLRSLNTEALQAEGELATIQRRLELSKKSVARYLELFKSGFVADIQVQQKQEELLDLAGREATAKRSIISVQREAQALRAEQLANSSSLQAQLTQIDRSSASLSQEGTENNARRELLVVAPQAGILTALTVNRGQLVQAGQTIATLVPHAPNGRPSRLEAQLFAPSRTAGFVKPGQTVWLRFSAYSYQKFGMTKGTVESVSHTPIGTQDLPAGQSQALQTAAQSNEPMYRVTVALADQGVSAYGEVHQLKAGMTLDADVVQEKRRIWEWILDPVLAASGLSTSLAHHAQ